MDCHLLRAESHVMFEDKYSGEPARAEIPSSGPTRMPNRDGKYADRDTLGTLWTFDFVFFELRKPFSFLEFLLD